jgi:hypothetical protein
VTGAAVICDELDTVTSISWIIYVIHEAAPSFVERVKQDKVWFAKEDLTWCTSPFFRIAAVDEV